MGQLPKNKSTLTKRVTLERLFSHSSLLAWLLLLALLPLLIATFFTYQSAKNTLLEQIQERLSHIVQEKIYQVENYISERKADINELAFSPEVFELVQEYKKNYNLRDLIALQPLANQKLGYYLNISFQGYIDLFLVSPQGEIWYSTNSPEAIGKNIQQFSKDSKQLIKVFEEANTLMSVQISDIEMGENELTPHFYLAAPVFEHGRISAILVFSLPSYQIQKVLTTIANLGKSGETLMAQPVGQEGLISSHQKISSESMSYLNKIEMGKILKDAGQGTSGFGKLIDQNNVAVLAAWHYLPSLGWGILVKINVAEAFEPIVHLRHRLYLLIALTLGLVILLARLVATNIRRAEERTEQLLLNILPVTIAERLKMGERTIADNFEATVLFCDIVGFTEFSNKMPPETIVQFLNNIFSRFDIIIERSRAEKIKTIGDAYMLVSGLPDPNPDHAKIVADVGLSMKKALDEFNVENNTNYQVRIGIASGAVTAGIVGFKKFSYDVWGQTVNLASRMESHGVAGKIQVTEQTYLMLKDDYDFEIRGEITVKGIGMMKTYFLNKFTNL
ncbi:MAG TPA: adenylate/guanylate cyclase domain-containing protein [Gammaproteobacteria bacterium]|nr:adenylate/guanylate cyclase domain-containing protein [Gammaproteobacteria bacterium]